MRFEKELYNVYHLIIEGLSIPFSYILHPEKRIYYLYLASSFLLAFLVYHQSSHSQSFVKYLLPKKIWMTNSTMMDVLLMFFNGFVKVVFIGPYLVVGLYIAFYTNEYMLLFFGYPSFSLGRINTLVWYTITLTIGSDLATYLIHLLMHKIPFLWEFHKVHHAATTLNPLTQYRIHPIELIINNTKSILMFGLITGLFDYLSNHQVDTILFLGVNIFAFFFMLLGANLRHSHVKLQYTPLMEKFLISPFQHQIHHSTNPLHYNKNLGSKLAVWDWLFGTLVLSKSVRNLTFGLNKADTNLNSFWGNIFSPFTNIFNAFKTYLNK